MTEFAAQATTDGAVRLMLDGAMLIYNAEEIKHRLIDALHSGRVLELDLSHVGDIDTAGFQLLVLAKQESLRQDKAMRIIAHSPAVLEIVEFYNMAAFFGDPLVIPASDTHA
ncbi:MAG: STAS domain-containing protein [Rhodocyclaceae bacterium]|jgi:anti-anti-sigma factor|nr:STAS domain-containing protein [Rhodocyclaceae bacterium]